MSMPIFRAVYAAILCLPLMGCLGAGTGGGPSVARAVSVADGAVTVVGPSGYCVDNRNSRLTGEAFIMLGSCAALSPKVGGPVGAPAILTATVSSNPLTVSPPLKDLETFLKTQAGRSALSRSGQAESVEIKTTNVKNDVLYLTIKDTAPMKDGEAVDPVYWRAIFALNGRLVTATVISFAEPSLGQEGGKNLLQQYIGALRAGNEAS